MLDNSDKIIDPDVDRLVETIRSQAYAPFNRAFLDINPDVRLDTRRMRKALDGTLTSNHVLTVTPEADARKEINKQGVVKKVVKKLLLKNDISVSEHKLLCEVLEIRHEVNKPKIDKVYLKYL
jgi:hypothetical protein